MMSKTDKQIQVLRRKDQIIDSLSKELKKKKEEIERLKKAEKVNITRTREENMEKKSKEKEWNNRLNEKDAEIKELLKNKRTEQKEQKQQLVKDNKELKAIQAKNKELEEKVINQGNVILRQEEEVKKLAKQIKEWEKRQASWDETSIERDLEIKILKEKNQALVEIEKCIHGLQNNEETDREKIEERSISATIRLYEAKQNEIEKKEDQIRKMEETRKKNNDTLKEEREKSRKMGEEIKTKTQFAEALIKEKSELTKVNLIYEENNRSLRSIVKHLELGPSHNDQNKSKQQQLRNRPNEGEANKKWGEKQKSTEKENKRKPKYMIPCKYDREGRCSFGKHCWYKHEDDKYSSKDEEKQGRTQTKFCRFEDQEKGCKFGPERCWFKHKRGGKSTKNEKEEEEKSRKTYNHEYENTEEYDEAEKVDFLWRREGMLTMPENWQTLWV